MCVGRFANTETTGAGRVGTSGFLKWTKVTGGARASVYSSQSPRLLLCVHTPQN